MRFGIEIVPFGPYTDPRNVVEIAVAAEHAGWDAISVWDHANFFGGVGDPWVTLTAVATATSRLRLVTAVSPVPRYRPHLLARTLCALDTLSAGRVTLGAGLGVPWDLDSTGDGADDRTRAAMADEALDLIGRWYAGETVTHTGTHYRADAVQVSPPGVQLPRLPVWIGGLSRAALRRAARWDGWIVPAIDENQDVTLTPEQLAADVAYLSAQRRTDAPFDVAVDGTTVAGEAGRSVEYAEAGATWWFESLFGLRGSHAEMVERAAAGPPG
ncbi:LLM class flavin-dependent oxidoreductase [Cellulomonas sp. KRMCY2]|uniref:LLM class flavin-dependent oxidoreductase n=1 Tax=Cellulomonas sp. KRMCY2 TaxID=1304865 RepID=UPI00045E97E1|nr:LLM class flavin-dependent oxidoreductase [Cellulomonas sp. KRMCY2]